MTIISGGNFHGEPLALVLDFLSIAIAELGSISERRVYRLIAGDRKTPEFLVANSGLTPVHDSAICRRRNCKQEQTIV